MWYLIQPPTCREIEATVRKQCAGLGLQKRIFSPLAKQSICFFVININSMPNLLSCWTKNPVKVVTEAQLPGVVFDSTLTHTNNVDYLKTNCLKALDILKVVGHID